MNLESQASLNPIHIRSVERVIESYLYSIAHKKELLNWRGVRKSTGMMIKKEEALLNLSSESLNDAELIAVLPQIAKLNLVTVLELSQNYITGVGVEQILKFLPNLEQLGLYSCKLNLNQGCLHLAQFKRLRFVCVANNNLNSSDLDQLQASRSLFRVDFSENLKIDIVSKARLWGALAYNNQAILQHQCGVTPIDPKEKKNEKKMEYVRLNFEESRREVQQMEKMNAEIMAVWQSPARSSF